MHGALNLACGHSMARQASMLRCQMQAEWNRCRPPQFTMMVAHVRRVRRVRPWFHSFSNVTTAMKNLG